jgi:hypothetical protein
MDEFDSLPSNRDAWNSQFGTELRHHNDELTPAEAARINEYYDIEVYVGTHGQPRGGIDEFLGDSQVLKTPGERKAFELLTLPTPEEYDAAAAVVDTMRPGDVLFIEQAGFESHPDAPPPPPEAALGAETVHDLPKALLKALIGEMAVNVWQKWADSRRQWAEEGRAERVIDAWEYAKQLAAIKGIRTVYADYDAFELASVAAKGKSDIELALSPDKNDQAEGRRIVTDRSRKARNTVKDWAREHLPPEGVPPPERKPKLVILYGKEHGEDFQQGFNELGLNAKITVLKSTDNVTRAASGLFDISQQILQRPGGISGRVGGDAKGSIGLRGGGLGARGPLKSFKPRTKPDDSQPPEQAR